MKMIRLRDQEINIETYLKKKKIKRENMEESDTEICTKNIKKITAKLKNQLFSFSLHKTWNKKPYISKKIASLKVLFIIFFSIINKIVLIVCCDLC